MLLSVDDIVKLLDFYLSTTYMTLGTKFTMVQRWGFAVSVLIASMIVTFDYPPVFWNDVCWKTT